MSGRKFIIPEFGPLAGMRVIGAGSLIAMPFAASMLAEFGAEVIQIERPSVGDTYRTFGSLTESADGTRVGAAWIQEARNRLSMTLELSPGSRDAQEIFLGLIRESDVFIENMVWLGKLGIHDDELLRVNPALVIVHISGFGHREFGGVPEICEQASYDMIGQAFSGYAMLNGWPDRPPLLTAPALSDYVTALFSLFGLLTAYMDAQKTGRGQVVDVAQFEAQAKIMREAFTRRSLGLGDVERSGNRSTSAQPWDVFLSRDGRYMSLGAVGKAVYTRFLGAMGFDGKRFPYEEVAATSEAINSPGGLELDAEIKRWFSEHDADEIEAVMRRAKVPCSRINTVAECMEHPHFRSRDDFVTYTDQTLGREVCAFGVFPKLSATPGRIWRGAPTLGQDTDEILRRILGRSEADISRLHAEGVV